MLKCLGKVSTMNRSNVAELLLSDHLNSRWWSSPAAPLFYAWRSSFTLIGGFLLQRNAKRFSHCVKGSFLVQKLQILEKLENGSIWIFVSKLIFLSGKKFEIFEFSRLNWSKIVILWFWFGAILGQNRDFGAKSFNIWYILECKIQ